MMYKVSKASGCEITLSSGVEILLASLHFRRLKGVEYIAYKLYHWQLTKDSLVPQESETS
jgi:hypothetical protein